MQKIFAFPLCLPIAFIFCVSAILPIASFAQGQNNQAPYRPNEYIVQLFAGLSENRLIKELHEQDPSLAIASLHRLAPGFDIWLLCLQPNGENPQQLLRSIKALPSVAIAQFNHVVSLRETIPNDPSFAQQYSLRNTGQNNGTVGADIKATFAWDISTGGLTQTGDTIVVAVIDGGCQLSHPDLAANIWRNYAEIPGNGIDDDGNGYVDDINGWNAFNNTANIPNNQHGTHVSGIIGARGNNNVGVSGVNWNVKIMNIAGSSGNEATVVAAYLYALTQRKRYNQSNGAQGAFVVATNSSFGVDYGQASNFPIWCAMYDSMGVHGILSAGATINGNVNVDVQGDIPTTCPSNFLVSVTNTNNRDEKISGAGFGIQNIDIGAPGTNVLNTVTNSNYSSLTGTSMATPHVAGVIALMYSVLCPELMSISKTQPASVASIVKQLLLDGADSLASLNNLVARSRRLNALGALQRTLAYNCNPEAPPTAQFSAAGTSGCPGLTVSFNNFSSFNAESYEWIFPGGQPAASTLPNPSVTYNTLGNYDVILIAHNEFGSDTLVRPAYVQVNTSGIITVYSEDFESGTLQSMGWTVENPDGANTWQTFTTAGNTAGTRSAGINIFQHAANAGQRDQLISPTIDLSLSSNNELRFTHAHRRRNTNTRDSLIIKVSIDNGNSFPYRVLARAENGQGTFATGGLLNSNFVPAQTSDWCLTGNIGTQCLAVDLSAFDGYTQVRILFESFNNGGNNIYIDDVRIQGNCAAIAAELPEAVISFVKPVVCQNESLLFDASQSLAEPTTFSWSFPGGNPPASQAMQQSVSFTTPGVYEVQLIVGNAAGFDTTSTQITVIATPNTPDIFYNLPELSTNVSTGIQWHLNGQPIPGANQPVLLPTQNGNYSITFTDNFGCTATSAVVQVVNVAVQGIDGMNFNLFPNPVGETLFVSGLSGRGMVFYQLFDASGRLVYRAESVAAETLEIATQGLSPGLYILHLQQEGRSGAKRFVKQ